MIVQVYNLGIVEIETGESPRSVVSLTDVLRITEKPCLKGAVPKNDSQGCPQPSSVMDTLIT